jgi:hypothetical protein
MRAAHRLPEEATMLGAMDDRLRGVATAVGYHDELSEDDAAAFLAILETVRQSSS